MDTLYDKNVRVTFRIVDGYTGEIIQDVGEIYHPIPSNARIQISGDDNLLYVHCNLNFCACMDCMSEEQFNSEHGTY